MGTCTAFLCRPAPLKLEPKTLGGLGALAVIPEHRQCPLHAVDEVVGLVEVVFAAGEIVETHELR
jgi:hypothetical protein